MYEKIFVRVKRAASLYALKKPLERLKRLFDVLGYAKVFNILRTDSIAPRLLKS